MIRREMQLLGCTVPVIAVDTVVLGTGAAGYQAADRLWHYGRRDLAIVTENRLYGTSRNTGSDKQTYYKLSLSGGDMDSVRLLAQTLFDGGCVDGETALCEAALSTECFLHLAELGVEFPRSRYGEYVGYKTDHDPCCRATSVGPYTSKRMTQVLEQAVQEKDIPFFDGWQAIRLLVDQGKILGLLCCSPKADCREKAFSVFFCNQLVMATGAPAGMYRDSVYPVSQFGASGLAFEAGAVGKNLTEWQHGMASLRPRWNVSGTYMQCLPRFFSVGSDGVQQEFLSDFFRDRTAMLANIFLKGYQWPFEVSNLNGSSLIDLLVYTETNIKKRRVYLDFTQNPDRLPIDFSALPDEPRTYLENGGALQQTPFERLVQLNRPAAEYYREHGVDLSREPLEIAVCVQHNNGGLEVDAWWQTSVQGLFAVGEVAGTHGVHRPGGSALNAGQVGALRAAQWISHLPENSIDIDERMARCTVQIEGLVELSAQCGAAQGNVRPQLAQLQARMSEAASVIRSEQGIEAALNALQALRQDFAHQVRYNSCRELALLFRLRETVICQTLYLSAMRDYLRSGGRSRGSALYTDPFGQLPAPALPERFRFRPDTPEMRRQTQLAVYRPDACQTVWRDCRPIPEDDLFFENVWRSYRAGKNIY